MRELRNYVGGRWVDADGERFESFDPTTGELVATAPATPPDGVHGAVRAAREAFESGGWRDLRGAERGGRSTRWPTPSRPAGKRPGS